MKLSFKPKDLSGIFIYQTEKQTYYSDPFCKGGYIIGTSNEGKTYFLYTLTIPFAILIGFILYSLKFSLLLSIIIPVILIIIIYITFRVLFVKNKLIYDRNFEKPNLKTKTVSFSKKNSKKSLLILSLLLFAMFAAILWNILENAYQGVLLYLIVAIDAIFAITTIITFIVFIKKK